MDYIYILGIKLHKIKRKELVENIKGWLAGDKFHYVTTVNPEFVLAAQKDNEFKEIIEQADISVPDGMGLKFAAWFFGRNIYRTTGADLTLEILSMAREKKIRFFFFIWKHGLSSVEEVKDALCEESILLPPFSKWGTGGFGLEEKQGNIIIDGQAIEKDGSDIDWKKFHEFKPDILLIGLGAPYQEKLIKKIKHRVEQAEDDYKGIPLSPPLVKWKIKLAIGIGGTFDFLTGKIKRAPKFMRIIGLEWLCRVCNPPKPPHGFFYRFKRIISAVIVFPYYILKWRLRILFQYRKGVIAAIINKENKFLICERMDEANHWQFPQGGMDKKESIVAAAKREAAEEAGIKDLEFIKIIKNLYRYKFSQPMHLANLVKLKYGYKGQKKYIVILKYIGVEKEIEPDLKEFGRCEWICEDELIARLHPCRRKAGELVLNELKNYDKKEK